VAVAVAGAAAFAMRPATDPMSAPSADARQSRPPLAGGERAVFRFILALGVVSLFADVTYEGARSVIGPYLATLGASATLVGAVGGAGELVGYVLRLPAGLAADRTRRYWSLTIGGYVVNLFSVPLLALAPSWPLAAALVVSERLGRAIRVPARDAILAAASARFGRGRAFGLHEALDQIGAVAGPLLVAAVLTLGAGHRVAFALLAVPATAAIAALLWARAQFPHAEEAPSRDRRPGGAPPGFVGYAAFATLTTIGLVQFPLASFHASTQGIVAEPVIPLVFAVAMVVDAGAALASGLLYDRVGLRTLAVLPPLTMALPLLVFSTAVPIFWSGVLLWGAALGVQESTLRAVVADLSGPGKRGTAYGAFNALVGLAYLLGGVMIGFAYERSFELLVAIVTATQLAAAAALVPLLVRQR
jgi:MFS family permease